MFTGQYEHSIDEKGRMTIPVRFRDLLANGAFISLGFDPNLIVMPAASFEKVAERVQNMSMTDPGTRLLKRLVFGTADRVDVDKVGRILLPQFLREQLNLDGAVKVVGVGDHFEIWSLEKWAEQMSMISDTETNMARFAAYDLSA
jgi:MraZ protein